MSRVGRPARVVPFPAATTREGQDAGQTNVVTAESTPSAFAEALFAGMVPQAVWWARVSRWLSVLVGSKVLLTTALLLSGAPISSPESPFPPAVHLLLYVGFALAGIWLLLGGNQDGRARPLGAFFLLVALAFSREVGREWAESISTLVAPLGLLERVNLDSLLPLCLWLFAREFPQRPDTARVQKGVSGMLITCGAAGIALVLADGLSHVPGVPIAPRWTIDGRSNAVWFIVSGLILAALMFILTRSGEAHGSERRRSTWFALSLSIGFVPLFLEVVSEAISTRFEAWAQSPQIRPFMGGVLVACLLSIPVTTTYAVLARRVLDVRVVLRRALQCALAKYAFMALSLAPVARAVWVLASHPQMSLSTLDAATGNRVVFFAAIVGIIALTLTDRVLHGLDQFFFGPPYDARSIVTRVRTRFARAIDAGAIREITRDELGGVLEPFAISVLTFSGGSFEDSQAGRVLDHDSALIDCVARTRQTTLRITDRLLRGVELDGARWIARHGIELIVGLRRCDGDVLGLIGVAERRCERPYQQEDIALIVDVAAAAAFALERQALRNARVMTSSAARSEPAAECPQCGIVGLSTQTSLCSLCGEPLETCSLPHVINGKFLVRRRLGRGGMGIVYLAEDLTLRRYVAIKTLSYLSRAACHRSEREALAMASATHPNVGTIFGCEYWQDRPLLILEYLECGTLATRLASDGATLAQLVEWILRLCDGLATLHRHGRLHGDIKPSNIGFDTEGNPKLLDFGLTALITDGAGAPERGAPLYWGTARYQSPNARDHHTCGPQDDLWSLASVLFEAVLGPAALNRLIAGQHPQPLAICQSRSDVPIELATFLARALASDVEARPASAEEFALWLRHGRPIH